MCTTTAPSSRSQLCSAGEIGPGPAFSIPFLKGRRSPERFPSALSKAIRTTILFMYFLYITWCLTEVCLLRLLRKKHLLLNHKITSCEISRHTIAGHDDQRWSQPSQEMPDWIKEDRQTARKADYDGGAFCSHGARCWLTTLHRVSARVRPEVPDCALVDTVPWNVEV